MNIVLLFAFIILSCGERGNELALTNGFADLREHKSASAIKEGNTNTFEEILEQSPPESSTVIERKLIKNGDITFETANVKKTKIEIEKICLEFNAYISGESQNNYDDRLQYNQMIRVPADRFDELLLIIEPLASKIESKNINTQDVTEEFIDVETRLKTKKELETRYLEILKQAKTVTDIISIESQIATVRSEIESMEGRINYLKNQVSLSTLNITYYETIGTDFGFASKFMRSIGNGWENLLSFLIFLLSYWPFVLGIFGVAFWWWRRRKQVKAN